jgi:EpsI family protein
MSNPTRWRALLVLLLMCASAAAAHWLRPTAKLADTRPHVRLEQLFPKAFGDWVVDDRVPAQLVAPDAQALLNKLYAETLSRNYVNKQTGQRIMLSVAYGGDQSDATRAHVPEVCYPSQGFQVLARQNSSFTAGGQLVPVRQMLAQLGARIEPVSYWVVVGEHIAISGTQQKLAQLRYGFKGMVADGMLVRVSNIDSDRNTAASYALHQSFIQAMAPAIPASLRDRVLGAPGA